MPSNPPTRTLRGVPPAVSFAAPRFVVFNLDSGAGLYPKRLEDREGWKKRFGRRRLVACGAGRVTLLRGRRSLRLHIAPQLEQLGFAEAQAVERAAT